MTDYALCSFIASVQAGKKGGSIVYDVFHQARVATVVSGVGDIDVVNSRGVEIVTERFLFLLPKWYAVPISDVRVGGSI